MEPLLTAPILFDATDDALREFVRGIGRNGSVNLVSRPACGLGIRHGKPMLACGNPAGLLELVQSQPVVAFAAAPPSELTTLNAARFRVGNSTLRVTLADPPTASAFGPYAGRVVRVEYLGIHHESALADQPPVVTQPGGPLPPLWLSPPLLTGTPAEFADWLDRPQVFATGAAVLPPFAPPPADGYFAAGFANLRRKLRDVIGLKEAVAGEPLAVGLWRFLDARCLREVFTDGGFVGLLNPHTGQASAAVRMPLGGTVADYRRRFFLAYDTSALGCVAEAVRADARAACPVPLTFVTGDRSADWRVPVVPPSPAPALGSWHAIHDWVSALPLPLAAEFDRLVLIPHAATADGPANHAAAERTLAGVAVRADGSTADDPAWAGTLLTLLKFLLAGPRPTTAGLLPFVLSPDRGRWEATSRCLHYSGAAGDPERRRWRQLLPADATLDAIRGVRLDTPTARLDRGFTLS